MATKGKTFSVDIAKWVAHVEQREEITIREVAAELFRRVIMRTPVDTGRARGNWQCEIGSPARSILETTDPSGSATIEAMQEVVERMQVGDVIWLANNLPYILPLEFGHSKQAPNGMVGITVADFNTAVEKAIAKAKAKVPDAG